MLKIIKEMDENGKISPRKPLAALFLSICPGLGQQYTGHMVRGIVLYVSLLIISWLSAAIFMFVEGRISVALFAVPVSGFLFVAIDAFLLARKQSPEYRLRWFNRWWIYPVVFVLLLTTVNPLMDLIVGKTITRAHLAHTDSMAPTILNNDVLLVNKLAYRISKPQRGDVVLIDFNKKRDANITKMAMDDQLVRRIIALPGDTAEIKGRDVIVNGKKIYEPYAFYSDSDRILYIEDNFGPVTVPENSYLVLGDNRKFSIDSRILGPVSKELIGGKIAKIAMSWNLDEKRIKWDRAGMTIK